MEVSFKDKSGRLLEKGVVDVWADDGWTNTVWRREVDLAKERQPVRMEISRSTPGAHRAFFLDDEEKDRAVALMRRVEEFSGVVVLAYAFMSNHFHIFIYVPSAEEIGEGEILRRIRVLYRDASLSQVVATWNRLKTEEQELFKRARPTKKYVSRFEAYKSSFLRRMWNSAEFMRTFKQHFTMSFNGRREHSGTMFEGRYHERNHPAERPTMWRTSAYIDINAWEAGIAERPEDYRWCSFAAAAQGDRKARAGYAFMYGGGEWRVIRECHEQSMQEAMGEVLKAREAQKRVSLGRRNHVRRERRFRDIHAPSHFLRLSLYQRHGKR